MRSTAATRAATRAAKRAEETQLALAELVIMTDELVIMALSADRLAPLTSWRGAGRPGTTPGFMDDLRPTVPRGVVLRARGVLEGVVASYGDDFNIREVDNDPKGDPGMTAFTLGAGGIVRIQVVNERSRLILLPTPEPEYGVAGRYHTEQGVAIPALALDLGTATLTAAAA